MTNQGKQEVNEQDNSSDYGCGGVPSRLHPDERRIEPDGRYERRVDHVAYRRQDASYPQGRRRGNLLHGSPRGHQPAGQDGRGPDGYRRGDLRHGDARYVLPFDGQPDRRPGRLQERLRLRRVGGLQRLPLRPHDGRQVHRGRYEQEGDRRRRGQNVLDRRLYGPFDLPDFRRRCGCRAAGTRYGGLRRDRLDPAF